MQAQQIQRTRASASLAASKLQGRVTVRTLSSSRPVWAAALARNAHTVIKEVSQRRAPPPASGSRPKGCVACNCWRSHDASLASALRIGVQLPVCFLLQADVDYGPTIELLGGNNAIGEAVTRLLVIALYDVSHHVNVLLAGSAPELGSPANGPYGAERPAPPLSVLAAAGFMHESLSAQVSAKNQRHTTPLTARSVIMMRT